MELNYSVISLEQKYVMLTKLLLQISLFLEPLLKKTIVSYAKNQKLEIIKA